ncbi:hypothetical protein T4D_4153 [Trichinella pseudospiralis]|uniref:Uncharacterized protein n=1 Tax=Trichinella pseudospiralis TaxID=6337 RepID=A0A0V1G466_TRIPS|nr:hypothetical protein T4D_4153 [Trichinella pseudospiralis]
MASMMGEQKQAAEIEVVLHFCLLIKCSPDEQPRCGQCVHNCLGQVAEFWRGHFWKWESMCVTAGGRIVRGTRQGGA